jgi:hypothetical protein
MSEEGKPPPREVPTMTMMEDVIPPEAHDMVFGLGLRLNMLISAVVCDKVPEAMSHIEGEADVIVLVRKPTEEDRRRLAEGIEVMKKMGLDPKKLDRDVVMNVRGEARAGDEDEIH